MALDLDFRMHAERTPNPNSIKWVLSRPIMQGVSGAHFHSDPGAEASPLAARICVVEGVTAVFLGANFVTVSKLEDIEWTDLAHPIVEGIKAWAESGDSALGPDWEPPVADGAGEVVARIRRILEEEIRPYVAQDGGEITFAGYNNGVVEVVLQGACSGCPSSTVTLKMGIEARLKEEIPEITSVVAL